MQQLRLFIALIIPDKARRFIRSSFLKLPLHWDQYRAVPEQNMHITMKFLGPTLVTDIPGIIKTIESAVHEQTAFDFSTTSGLLLPKKNPQALTLGIAKSDELSNLASRIDEVLAIAGLGHQELRAFRPHITLARARTKMEAMDIEAFSKWDADSIDIAAAELVLYESIMKPQGPDYIALNSFLLS